MADAQGDLVTPSSTLQPPMYHITSNTWTSIASCPAALRRTPLLWARMACCILRVVVTVR